MATTLINDKSIKILQDIVSGLICSSKQHFLHSIINRKKGFVKLADRMLEEYNEETTTIAKFTARLLELGNVPKVESLNIEVLYKVQEQFKMELEEQIKGMDWLNKVLPQIKGDKVTEQLLTSYLQDENKHLSWLKQQVSLIETIGLQNYLSRQL